jgi:RNase P subunit RPR2
MQERTNDFTGEESNYLGSLIEKVEEIEKQHPELKKENMKKMISEVEDEIKNDDKLRLTDLIENMIEIGKKLPPHKRTICKKCGQPYIPHLLKKFHVCQFEEKEYTRNKSGRKVNNKPVKKLTVKTRKES